MRASKKLKGDELLITSFAATRLRMELDRVPLWRGDRVAVKQLAEDFASYVYLPRLSDPSVLLAAIREGVALLTWENDSFAFADSFDEEPRRYRGLRVAQNVSLPDADAPGLLVRPAVARRQLDAEVAKPGAVDGPVAPPRFGPPVDRPTDWPTDGPTVRTAPDIAHRGAFTERLCSTRPELAATPAGSPARSSPISSGWSVRKSG